MLDLLSPEELRTLTGYKRGSKQLSWLLQRGFKAVEGRDGTPVVLRSHVEAVLSPAIAAEKAKTAQPNFEALRMVLRKESNRGQTSKIGKRMAA